MRAACDAVVADAPATSGARKRPKGHAGRVLRAIWRLLLYRVLGGRLLLGLTILGWIRRQLRGRGDQRIAQGRSPNERPEGGRTAYQPSQGSSQIEHRDPR
jgi:hypothetical protein